MEIIPLIRLKKRKILGYSTSSSKDILKEIDENEKIYILDLDGIEKDKPNLCTFQRISDSYNLWVDFGPRNLGDIVDAIMAGASSITLRKNLWPHLEITDIRDITENEIYANIDLKARTGFDIGDFFINEADGLVNFNSRKEVELDFKFSDYLNRMKMKNKLYSYEIDQKNSSYWKRFGVKGILVDIGKLKEFKNGL